MLFNNPYSRLMAQSGVAPQPQPGPMSLMMPAAMGPAQPSQMPVGPMTPAPPQPVTQAAFDGPNVGPMPSLMEGRPQPREERIEPYAGQMAGIANNLRGMMPNPMDGLGGMVFDDDPATLGDQFSGALGWLGNDIGNLFGSSGPAPWGPSGQIGNIGAINDLFGGWGALMG